MDALIWPLVAFCCGALPFSVWIGRWVLGRDIRQVGDANPGATNVLRAGGRLAAAGALLLDLLKGAAPVGLAHFVFGVGGWPLVVVALAPVLGHAFSPLLGFRGGKAVATTGGIWCGLTLWEGPTVGGLLLGVAYWLIDGDGWAVIVAVTGLVLYLLVSPATWNLFDARPAGWIILAVGAGNLVILGWKHRADLARPFTLRRRKANASL
jgi:acyl phosphate:glycerol-3-phosphate acyltransferase